MTVAETDGGRLPERLGVFGGTFDPPHFGHAAAARACIRALELDRLLFVVANEPWQKVGERRISDVADRVAMVEEVAAAIPGAEMSLLEVERGGPSYTIDTLEALDVLARGRGAPAPAMWLVVGSDLVSELETWRRPEDVRSMATLAVVSRPGAETPAMPRGWRSVRVEAETPDISSSHVRDRVRRGLRIDDLVPEAVLRYISERALYAVHG